MGFFKRGFDLDLRNYGGEFLGEAYIPGAVLLDLGGGTGLRFVKDPLKVDRDRSKSMSKRLAVQAPVPIAHGELFEVPEDLWTWLDYIEGNGRVYRRKVVDVKMPQERDHDGGEHYGIYIENAFVYEHIYYENHGGYDDIPIIKGGNFV